MKIEFLLHPLLVLFLFTVSTSSCKKESKLDTEELLRFAENQMSNTLEKSDDPQHIPRTVDSDLVTVGIYNWTSGFFAGNLWYLYELTGNERWKTEAIKYTEVLDPIQFWTGIHDVGFMINCSYGNGLRLANKVEYKKVLIQAAESLCHRYSPITKSIKSWNYRKAWDKKTEWFYPVIIDNMMNLELLFKASELSGDSKYKDIAIQHAETTIKNHYRNDYSSYHVVDYDTITGSVLDKATCQGFTDESAWARGQAWGFYGFVMCYRYTKDPRHLAFAENIANYLLNHPNLPKDQIPYWDYNAPDDNHKPEWDYDSSKFSGVPRDVSAACIITSALFELADFSAKGEVYTAKAKQMLSSLTSPEYLAETDRNKYFILDHSVGSIPHEAEIDVPLVYADYYFLEALIRNGNSAVK